MTRTEELLAWCASAWERGRTTEVRLGYTGDMAGKYVVQIANKDLKQLVKLVRLQNEALNTCDVGDVKYPDDTQFYDDHKVEKAIDAFNKWEGK